MVQNTNKSPTCNLQVGLLFMITTQLPASSQRWQFAFLQMTILTLNFAPIFEPKSWSQTNKLNLVFLKLKNRKPLYLQGISDFSWLGARTDSVPVG